MARNIKKKVRKLKSSGSGESLSKQKASSKTLSLAEAREGPAKHFREILPKKQPKEKVVEKPKEKVEKKPIYTFIGKPIVASQKHPARRKVPERSIPTPLKEKVVEKKPKGTFIGIPTTAGGASHARRKVPERSIPTPLKEKVVEKKPKGTFIGIPTTAGGASHARRKVPRRSIPTTTSTYTVKAHPRKAHPRKTARGSVMVKKSTISAHTRQGTGSTYIGAMTRTEARQKAQKEIDQEKARTSYSPVYSEKQKFEHEEWLETKQAIKTRKDLATQLKKIKSGMWFEDNLRQYDANKYAIGTKYAELPLLLTYDNKIAIGRLGAFKVVNNLLNRDDTYDLRIYKAQIDNLEHINIIDPKTQKIYRSIIFDNEDTAMAAYDYEQIQWVMDILKWYNKVYLEYPEEEYGPIRIYCPEADLEFIIQPSLRLRSEWEDKIKTEELIFERDVREEYPTEITKKILGKINKKEKINRARKIVMDSSSSYSAEGRENPFKDIADNDYSIEIFMEEYYGFDIDDVESIRLDPDKDVEFTMKDGQKINSGEIMVDYESSTQESINENFDYYEQVFFQHKGIDPLLVTTDNYREEYTIDREYIDDEQIREQGLNPDKEEDLHIGIDTFEIQELLLDSINTNNATYINNLLRKLALTTGRSAILSYEKNFLETSKSY